MCYPLDAMETKNCSWCQRDRPLAEFYSISKRTGKLRGQCKTCVKIVKRLQRDPAWKPPCVKCGALLPRRSLGGRRLCPPCLDSTYGDALRPNGAHRKKLTPCRKCGGPKEYLRLGALCAACSPWREEGKRRPIPGETRQYRRGADLWEKYGITGEQYDAMLVRQGGVCKLCGRPPKTRRLAVDHDHGTDARGVKHRVRGLLCHICNKLRVGINTAETARAVLVYLESDFDGRTL